MSYGEPAGQGLINLIKLLQKLIVMAGPILVSLAVLAFFYGLVIFIWKGRESEEKRKNSKTFMAFSLFAIFAMVSVWGIVAFIANTLGIVPGGSQPKVDVVPPGWRMR